MRLHIEEDLMHQPLTRELFHVWLHDEILRLPEEQVSPGTVEVEWYSSGVTCVCNMYRNITTTTCYEIRSRLESRRINEETQGIRSIAMFALV